MGIFHCVLLLCQVAIFKTVYADSTEIPGVVDFSVLSEEGEEIEVNLVPTETFLANENVPVWIPNPKDPSELIVMKDIMEKLTPFTVYQDPSNCAAALYYHKRKQFDGTIGHHHIIWKLKYNPVTKKVEPTGNSIFASPLKKHNENRLLENEDVIVKKGGNIMRRWNKSLQKYPETVYVETLVMVDFGITQKLQFDYVSIVSYVLTIFNSVDMIYSKIKIPNIKINIAGIIIGTTHMTFSKLDLHSCYERITDNHRRLVVMNGICGINAIRLTLNEYHTLPAQSYDIAIFLSKSPMFLEVPKRSMFCRTKKLPCLGLAALPSTADGFRLSSEDIGMAIVGNANIFGILPTAAHEIAHLLGVPHDDGPLWSEDGKCDAHLMKKDNSYCKKCLKFGGMTPEYLRKFFESRGACIFYNEPRSLNNPSGPRSFWNEHEQCKCYGYKSAYKPINTIRSSIEQLFSSTVDCKTRLKCVNENGQVDETGYYMDGTPCDRKKMGKKVCWDKKCLTAQKDRVCKQRN